MLIRWVLPCSAAAHTWGLCSRPLWSLWHMIGRQQCPIYLKRKHGGWGITCSKKPKCPLTCRVGVEPQWCPLGLTETSVASGSAICVHGPLPGPLHEECTLCPHSWNGPSQSLLALPSPNPRSKGFPPSHTNGLQFILKRLFWSSRST